MKTKALFTGIMMIAAISFACAQSETKKTENTEPKQTTSFVDTNENGICDNYENGTHGNRQGKAYHKGNGNYNWCDQSLHNGKEHRNSQRGMHKNAQCSGQGQGTGLKNGQGQGTGQFEDKNNNGVCDKRE